MMIEQRKYVCFCCKVLPFNTYYEYQQHIISTHEEGRDYVLCPLARCRAPVRCVKSHFAAHHPTEKSPSMGQLRALIWRDSKAPKKKKPKFHEGYINSQKNGGQMHYRSGWERDVYICLENLSEILGYKVEKFPVEYYWRGKCKRYYPDLFVTFKDGRSEVWEIKPNNQRSLEINQAKWLACENHCESRGWKFKIIDETVIKQLKQEVRLEIGKMVNNGKKEELPQNFFEEGIQETS